jgi:hypothetical protein
MYEALAELQGQQVVRGFRSLADATALARSVYRADSVRRLLVGIALITLEAPIHRRTNDVLGDDCDGHEELALDAASRNAPTAPSARLSSPSSS